jgi:perosamine synthetase
MNEKLLKALILPQTATLRDAMHSFEETGFQFVLISSPEGKLAGIATEGDVRRALLAGHGLISPLFPHANQDPVVGRMDMPREELIALLSDRVHFLPVLDGHDKVQDVLFHDKRIIIPVATPIIGEKELLYVTDAVLSGWISSQGKYIGQFEEQFASFCGTKYAVAVSNGTVALHLALTALGIGPGDEVIIPALTFVATANTVRYCNANPVFVDIHRGNWNIDPDMIEEAITPRTKAIIPVHLYGQPCDMERIMEIAERHHLFVVEDAAEAHGAEYNGRRVGSLGHMGCFSFYGNKIITTGEGGMVVTNDTILNEQMRILRDHGMHPGKRYWHEVVGFNYRMTNIQAAIGVAQLERWEQIISAKDRIQKFYDNHLDFANLQRSIPLPGSRPVCWLYTVLLKDDNDKHVRDVLLERLKSYNIDSRPVFNPLPAMPPYFVTEWMGKYPITKWIAERGFSLPSSVEIGEINLLRITECFNKMHLQVKDEITQGGYI